MRVKFIKGHGSGNDFPLIDARALELADDDWAILARAMADRRGAIGGDGLLALTRGDKTHAFGMRMWNPDGSEAETCLNGLRMVARLGFEALGAKRAAVHLKTSTAEVARAADIAPGVHTIAETAGPAMLGEVEARFPQLSDERLFTRVAMPNPHLVSFVDRIDEADLVRIGRLCEAAPEWLPDRANVSFVEVRGAELLYVRTFERGVGLTSSCGSAMAASAFVAALTGRTAFGTEITVLNKGGRVRARAESDGMTTLHGNATFEWEGEVSVELATGVAADLTVTRRFNDEVEAWATAVNGAGA